LAFFAGFCGLFWVVGAYLSLPSSAVRGTSVRGISHKRKPRGLTMCSVPQAVSPKPGPPSRFAYRSGTAQAVRYLLLRKRAGKPRQDHALTRPGVHRWSAYRSNSIAIRASQLRCGGRKLKR
jgi:hypothetical protein